MQLPDGEYIPAPLLHPAVHRLALLTGLQGQLVGNVVIGVDVLAAALALGLRDLRLVLADATDWSRWDPVMRYATAGAELSLEILAARVGEAQFRVATAEGSARFVVEWLNAPRRQHEEAHRSLRQRGEERARRLAAVTAASNAGLALQVAGVCGRVADLARWQASRAAVPVFSPNGQIASWPQAMIQAEAIQSGLATVAELLATEVGEHGDL